MGVIPPELMGTYSGMLDQLAWAGVLIGAIIVIAVIGFYLTRLNQYGIFVTIYSKRAGMLNYKIFKDRAAFVKNREGQFDFKLRGFKKILAPPPNDYIFVNEKGKNEVILYQVNENQFYFVKPVFFDVTNKQIKFRASDEDVRFWVAMDMQRSRNIYGKEKLIDKLMPLMVIAVTGLICLLLLYFTTKSVHDMQQPLTDLAKALAEIANAMRNLHTSQPIPA